MNKTAKEVVWYATVCALTFVARLLDHMVTGFLPINAAIVTLTVVYACILIRPTFVNAIATGTVFGIMSLVTSVMYPGGFTQYFVNPLVSVLPRMAVGVAMWAVYRLIKMLGKCAEIPATAVACAIGSCVNTFCVMTMIFFFMRATNDVTYAYVFGLVTLSNFLFELILPAVIVPGIAFGVRRGLCGVYGDCEDNKEDNNSVNEQDGEEK